MSDGSYYPCYCQLKTLVFGQGHEPPPLKTKVIPADEPLSKTMLYGPFFTLRTRATLSGTAAHSGGPALIAKVKQSMIEDHLRSLAFHLVNSKGEYRKWEEIDDETGEPYMEYAISGSGFLERIGLAPGDDQQMDHVYGRQPLFDWRLRVKDKRDDLSIREVKHPPDLDYHVFEARTCAQLEIVDTRGHFGTDIFWPGYWNCCEVDLWRNNADS
jgi:hypothetical protein